MKEEEKELQAFAIARDGIGVILLSTVQNPIPNLRTLNHLFDQIHGCCESQE
jgi:hypothetical protein